VDGWEKRERGICVCLSSGPSPAPVPLEMLLQESTLSVTSGESGRDACNGVITLPLLPQRL